MLIFPHHIAAKKENATAIKLPASGKTIFKKFTFEEIQEASELQAGFCLSCGELRDMVEPDARRYKCEACGLREVYGAEEIFMMGLIKDGQPAKG